MRKMPVALLPLAATEDVHIQNLPQATSRWRAQRALMVAWLLGSIVTLCLSSFSPFLGTTAGLAGISGASWYFCYCCGVKQAKDVAANVRVSLACFSRVLYGPAGGGGGGGPEPFSKGRLLVWRVFMQPGSACKVCKDKAYASGTRLACCLLFLQEVAFQLSGLYPPLYMPCNTVHRRICSELVSQKCPASWGQKWPHSPGNQGKGFGWEGSRPCKRICW